MGVPGMALLPQFAASPPPAQGASGTAKAGGDGKGFGNILAGLAPVLGRKPEHDGPRAEKATGKALSSSATDQLEMMLQALTSGQLNLWASGLGVTKPQLDELVTGLRKALRGSGKDGVEVLACLLGGSQLASGGYARAADAVALTELFSTGADGSISAGSVGGNLRLLLQALQLVQQSDGQLTLQQAIEDLAPKDDVFASKLEELLESDLRQANADAEPVSVAPATQNTRLETRDSLTGVDPPPKDVGQPGTSATAGSNGRESTPVSTTGSPADGAAEEGTTEASDHIAELARALHVLIEQEQAARRTNAATVSPSGGPSAIVATPVSTEPGSAIVTQPVNMSQTAQASSQRALPGSGKADAQPAVESADYSVIAGTAEQSAGGTQHSALSTQHSPDAGSGQMGGQTGNQEAKADPAQAVQAPAGAPLPFGAPALGSGDPAQATPSQPKLGIEHAILDQLVQNATVAIRDGQQEFRVQLKPEFLGNVDVRVTVDNGMAVVRLSAESAATTQLIETNLGQLRQALGSDRIQVDHVANFGSWDASSTYGQSTPGGSFGGWFGQPGSDGAGRWYHLPEAIPFSGDSSPETTDSGATSSVSPVVPATVGAVDIQV